MVLLRVRNPPMADWLEGFVPMKMHALIRFGRLKIDRDAHRVQLLRTPVDAMEQPTPRQVRVAVDQRLTAAAFRGNSREPVVKLHDFRSRR